MLANDAAAAQQDMFPSLMRMSILPQPSSHEGNTVLRGEMKQLIRNGSLTKEHRALLKTAEHQKPNKRIRSQSPSLSGALHRRVLLHPHYFTPPARCLQERRVGPLRA